MDEQEKRRILAEALDTIERVKREQEERRPEREQRAANELLYENGTRRPNSKTMGAHRIDDGGLIYKTTRQPEPEPKVSMNAENAKAWEAWADARTRTLLQQGLGDLAEILGAEVGQIEKRFNAELTRLADQIAELREEVAILRTAKNITTLTPLRPRDVA